MDACHSGRGWIAEAGLSGQTAEAGGVFEPNHGVDLLDLSFADGAVSAECHSITYRIAMDVQQGKTAFTLQRLNCQSIAQLRDQCVGRTN
jgi:hypothetical protein